MKSTFNPLYVLGVLVFMLALSGCQTNSMMHCPDLTSIKKMHVPTFAFNTHVNHKTIKPGLQVNNVIMADSNMQHAPLLATTDKDMHFKIQMPTALMQNMQSDEEIADMNKLLLNYTDNKVALQRNANGKLYLKAHKLKDIFALAKPRGYYERRQAAAGDRSGSAIASSILGPISFIFAFIPFLSLVAIPVGIAAIITGGIGMRSPRQRRAVIGLTFGILGLIIGILFSILYAAVFGIALL